MNFIKIIGRNWFDTAVVGTSVILLFAEAAGNG